MKWGVNAFQKTTCDKHEPDWKLLKKLNKIGFRVVKIGRCVNCGMKVYVCLNEMRENGISYYVSEYPFMVWDLELFERIKLQSANCSRTKE